MKKGSSFVSCDVKTDNPSAVRRSVDAFPEQLHPIVKVVTLQVQFLQSPLREVHLGTDLASLLKLQSSGFLPFAPVFVDPFSNGSVLICFILFMNCKVT